MNSKLPVFKELLLYTISTYIFSWLFWIPSAFMFKEAETVGDIITSPLFISLQTLGAAGPSVVAYLFLKKFHPSSDLKSIIDRYKIWAVEIKWYFISIFLVITISLTALCLHIIFLDSPLVDGHALYDMFQEMGFLLLAVLPIIYISQIFSSPLLEEFGWRGYAQPLLQEKVRVLQASAVIGIVWAFWHLPLMFAYGHHVVIAILSIVCHGILMGWILNSTRGSMVLVLLFHASINLGVNIISPGHNSMMMFILTIGITLFIVYWIKIRKLKPFQYDIVMNSPN